MRRLNARHLLVTPEELGVQKGLAELQDSGKGFNSLRRKKADVTDIALAESLMEVRCLMWLGSHVFCVAAGVGLRMCILKVHINHRATVEQPPVGAHEV